VEAAVTVSNPAAGKTGTITFANRKATELIPVVGSTPEELRGRAAGQLADETPRAQIVELTEAGGAAQGGPGWPGC